jgi:hypothetical protein
MSEGTVIPGEAEGGSLNPTISEQREEAIKEAARAKGWTSKKDWSDSGKPIEEWVPAKEFVGRQKLFDKIHDLKNQLSRQSQKNEGELSQIRKHLEQVREVEYKKAVEELRAERREAISTGDAVAADRIDDRIDDLRQEQADKEAELKKQVVSQNVGPSQDFLEWKQTNTWFDQDSDMTQVALEIGTAHAQANPSKAHKDVLEYVTTRIKKMYPEKFTRRTVGDVEGAGAPRVTPKNSGGKGALRIGDLSEDERKVYDMYVKRRVFKDVAAKNKRSEQEETLAQMAVTRGQN